MIDDTLVEGPVFLFHFLESLVIVSLERVLLISDLSYDMLILPLHLRKCFCVLTTHRSLCLVQNLSLLFALMRLN